MSYIFLRERGEESSAECFSDIPAFAPSKSSLIAGKSCCSGSETESFQNFRFGTTCGHLTAGRGGGKSTSSAAASRARTFHARAKARESAEREAGFGLNLQESLAKYDRATSSWRTRQCLLFGGLEECLVTFPKAGTMRNGVLWELTMWERLTSEKECGFWRTPDTGVGKEISESKARDYANKTPRPSGYQIQIRLCDQVKYPMLWPTPKCQDSRAALWDRGKSNLGEVVHGGIETLPTKTARLNPAWVEWLMGWPIGWTDLKPLGMDKFRSWRQGLSSS